MSLPVAQARSAKKTAKRSAPSGVAAPPPKRQCQAEFQATLLAHMEGFAGRPRSRWSCAHSTPCSATPAIWRCMLLLESRAVPTHTLALCLECRSVASVSLSCQFAQSQKPMRLPANLDLAELAKPPSVLDRPEALTGGEVRSGSRTGDNRSGKHRGSQRRRIRRKRAPSGRPCPGAAHSTHPSRVPWNYHCGARDESAGGCDDSSWRVLELAATREGTSTSPLWALPNFTKGHRRGQNRRIRTRASYILSDLRDVRVCSKG